MHCLTGSSAQCIRDQFSMQCMSSCPSCNTYIIYIIHPVNHTALLLLREQVRLSLAPQCACYRLMCYMTIVVILTMLMQRRHGEGDLRGAGASRSVISWMSLQVVTRQQWVIDRWYLLHTTRRSPRANSIDLHALLAATVHLHECYIACMARFQRSEKFRY